MESKASLEQQIAAALVPDSATVAPTELGQMARADIALQQMTDAVASLPNLDSFISAALRIVASVFQAKDCAYYQHRLGERIRLRYWLVDNRVLGPTDIEALEEDEFSILRYICTKGFVVPDSYIGVPFRMRTKASVVDHRVGNPPSVFDDYCNSRGWNLELNAPLVVNGEADGAFLVYRPTGSTFSAWEIALAERLAQQFALAVELSRLSAMASHAAVADERERAAQQRADELLIYSESLRKTIDSLVSQDGLEGVIGHFLMIASKQMQSPVVEYWTEDCQPETKLTLTCRQGVIYAGSDDLDDVRVRGINVIEDWKTLDETGFPKKFRIVDMFSDQTFRKHVDPIGMPVEEWCRLRGVQKFIFIPLLRNDLQFGAFIVYFAKERVLDQPFVDFVMSFAQHLSVAVLMTDMAGESKRNAVALEREAAAQERASELSKANGVLQRTLEQLSLERDLHSFPLTILRTSIDQIGARDGVVLVFDKSTNSLRTSEYLHSADSLPAQTERFEGSFQFDSAPIWGLVMDRRAPMTIDVESEGHLLLPGAADWNRGRKNLSVVIAPIFVRDELYGFFGFGMKAAVANISKVDLGVLQALTQQATLAIQMTHLADESQTAALAQERAAEFANANEVLRSALDQLSKENDLNTFPRTILKEAMNQTAANHGLILRYDALTDTLTPAEYASGDNPHEDRDTTFSKPFPASRTPAWVSLVSSRSPIVFDVEADAARMLPGLAAWHRKMGNRSVVAAPMFIDGKPYGYFGITLSEPASEVSKVKLGLIHALSQQATLAIQLTRLADASEQAAVLVERQQVVVQERANLAREIHDRLAQGYAAILIQQHSMRRFLMNTPASGEAFAPLLEHLDVIERLSKTNLAEARKTMDDLTIDPFGPGDLAHALKQSLQQLPRDREFEILSSLEHTFPPVRRYVEAEVCRIVLEAVMNARKHARARSVSISSQRRENGFAIIIEDAGVGFDIATIGNSFGISSMRERAARADAELQILTSPGAGTQVKVLLKV